METSATIASISRTELPRVLTACLTVRIGEPHGNARGGWKRDVMFDVDEGYDVFRAKCITKLNELASSADVLKRKKQIALGDDSDIYLMRSGNENQDKYGRLSRASFVESLQRRWKLLKPSDRAPENQFKFLAFLYVRNITPAASSAAFQRATEKRVQQARLQRLAHESSNAVSFGAITSHHLDIVNARRPDAASFHVPDDNTTAQAMEIDRQREGVELQQAQDAEVARAQTATIRLQWSGVWIPAEVDVISLRRAVGLPDYNIFSAGIYHDFRPSAPTQPELDDVEHKEESDEGNEEANDSMMEGII